ncbi:MAG: metallophosphoesterase [Pseudomonadota bacterium]|nr:metallophosphoesterase [Pseudomonadota bacterium]
MTRKRRFTDRLLRLVTPANEFIEPAPGQRLRLSGLGTQIPLPDNPIEVELGKERLYIQKDLRRGDTGDADTSDLIIFNPDRYFSGIGYALRLESGHSLQISHKHEDQIHLFSVPREAFRRHFQVDHEGDSLVFRDPISELGTYITVLEHPVRDSILIKQRQLAMSRLLEIFGGDVDLLPPKRAMKTIRRVNELLLEEPYRRLDQSGNVGGIIELPAEPTPVIVGDLHANTDNLLNVLVEGGLLQSLEDKTAVLLFLGDLIHPDFEPFDYMDSSVLIMDLLFLLKLHFPENVFILHGNHESFSPELSKRGVPQALLLQKRLTELRGEAYCTQMEQFYERSPVLAVSRDFVACHAGPARAKTSLDDIVNIRQHPDLAHDLTWNRIKRAATPSGYAAGDVRRFRKSLGIDSDTPFLVGHYPYANDGTLWLEVGGIKNHHIVYSAKPDQIGLFTRIDGVMVPRVLPVEPLLEILDAQAAATRDTAGPSED